MDIVRIKLMKPNSFWFLNDLHLGPGNILSPPFDLDEAESKIKEKIVRAENDFRVIKVIRQPEGTVPMLNINTDSTVRFELPKSMPRGVRMMNEKKAEEKTEATLLAPQGPEAETEMPELKSITLEPEPEPEIEETLPSEQDFDNAKALLARNGNTIKKVIRTLDKPAQEIKAFLLACLEVERTGKNRKGTIACLEEAFLGVS